MPNLKGFTLIELLIVIVLIGIVSSMTMLSMNNTGNLRDQQKQEAERLLHLFQLASQEAIIRGEPVAVEYDRHGYRFMMMDNGRWRTEIQDALFKPRTLHPQLFIDLQLDKQAILLHDQANAVPNPHIVFTPDGDISLFRINIGLNGSDETFIVSNSLNNGLTVAAQSVAAAL
ncbi:MAG: type II secretion system minor pseudopilin GspH [Methylococcaceae bacterium]